MKLSANFDSSEFRSHDGAPTSRSYLAELRTLCILYLQPLRDRFGATTITSGHRSAAENERVGGARQSRHLDLPGQQGAAADAVCARGRPAEWAEFLDARGAPGVGRYADHVHVDTRKGRARW